MAVNPNPLRVCVQCGTGTGWVPVTNYGCRLAGQNSEYRHIANSPVIFKEPRAPRFVVGIWDRFIFRETVINNREWSESEFTSPTVLKGLSVLAWLGLESVNGIAKRCCLWTKYRVAAELKEDLMCSVYRYLLYLQLRSDMLTGRCVTQLLLTIKLFVDKTGLYLHCDGGIWHVWRWLSLCQMMSA